jgi:hypothetical protein
MWGHVIDPSTVDYIPGAPLAGGYFLVLWLLLGDLQHMEVAYGFPNHNKVSGMCALCGCGRDWTDFDEHPSWESTRWHVLGLDAWRAANSVRIALLQLPGASVLLWLPDWMHCKNIGTDKEFYGSVLEFMCYHMVAGDAATLLTQYWRRIYEWYMEHGTHAKFSNLKLSMFHKLNDFPLLRGRAAEVRSFGKPLLHVFTLFMDTGNVQHRWILNALRACVRMEDIVNDRRYKQSFKLPGALAAELDACCVTFGRHVAGLRRWCRTQDLRLFKVTSKMHFLREITMLAKYLHPRLGACWSGEDMMHHMQRLIQSTLSASDTMLVQRKAMLKYAAAMGHAIMQYEQRADTALL